MTRKTCPNCGSKRINVIKYRGQDVIMCGDCGFDGTDELDMSEEYRNTQREKRRYSPYKSRT